jgi:hypothetical protein
MPIRYISIGPLGKIIPIEELDEGFFRIYGLTFCVKFFETCEISDSNDTLVSIFTINSYSDTKYGTIYKFEDIDLYFATHDEIVYIGTDPIIASAKLIAEV